ncbi:MAG: glycosyltransferase [Verrucomicrobia bacterium]|nr:MAG: glycosyltransferase [Verrucomicrobiota bacterium]
MQASAHRGPFPSRFTFHVSRFICLFASLRLCVKIPPDLDPNISIVVPLRNEEANVLELTRQIFAAFLGETQPLELVLVDDASTDETWQRILQAQRTEPRIRALRHASGGGQSAALWTGFRASKGSIICTLDGDLQNDPADLPRLMKELSSCDLACGVRLTRRDSGLRKISSAVARTARRIALGVDFRDSGCNLRVFRREVLETIPPFDGFHRFMPILADGAGLNVREVPVNHRPRTAGKTKYGVWNRLGRGVRDLVMVALYRKRQLRHIPTEEHKTLVSTKQSVVSSP